jgi:hypothetical protein
MVRLHISCGLIALIREDGVTVVTLRFNEWVSDAQSGSIDGQGFCFLFLQKYHECKIIQQLFFTGLLMRNHATFETLLLGILGF